MSQHDLLPQERKKLRTPRKREGALKVANGMDGVWQGQKTRGMMVDGEKGERVPAAIDAEIAERFQAQDPVEGPSKPSRLSSSSHS